MRGPPSWIWFAVVTAAAGALGLSGSGKADPAVGRAGDADGSGKAAAHPKHQADSTARQQRSKPAPDATSEPARADGVISILRDFSGEPASVAVVRGGLSIYQPARQAVERIYRLGYGRVDVLVATLPDPMDSAFAKLFDDGVSAMQVALERSGYVVDRFFDPWRRDLDHEEKANAGDPSGGAATSAALAPRRQQPGALLFRRVDHGVRQLLVLLLVGETPTWGVHRSALGAALDVAHAIADAACRPPAAVTPPDDDAATAVTTNQTTVTPRTKRTPGGPAAAACAPPTVPLLAPATSGTTESLRATVTEWFHAQAGRPPHATGRVPFNLSIVSGSATAGSNKWILSTELEREVRKTFPSFTATFEATVHSEDQLRGHLMKYLNEQLGIHSVALLTESTTYGEQFLRSSRHAHRDGPQVARIPGIVNLSFPLHISKLRSEYDRQHLQDGTGEKAATPEPSREVALASDDASTEDAFPPKSKVTEAASDLALTQILRAIATQDVRAVAIVATDPQDVLFLVRRVKALFPNVTVCVIGADLVYLHDEAPFMRGVLVVSTYPLFPWNQRLSYPFAGETEPLQFPTSRAEGIFNATILLLGKNTDVSLLEYGPPFATGTSDLRPPVWMTVVGDSAFWPLAASASDDSSGYLARYVARDQPQGAASDGGDAAEPATSDRALRTSWMFPHCFSFLVMLALLTFAGVIIGAAYVRGQWGNGDRFAAGSAPRSDRTAGRVLDLFLPPRHYAHPHMQRFGIAGLLVTFLLVDVAFAATALITVTPEPAEIGRAWRILVLCFCLETTLLLMLSIHAVVCWVVRAVRSSPGPHRLSTLPALVMPAVVVGLLWPAVSQGWRYLTEADAPAVHFFVGVRARNLASGGSVLATALRVALAHMFWHLGHLRQVRIVEDADVLRSLGVVPRSGGPVETPGSLLAVLSRSGARLRTFLRSLRTPAAAAKAAAPPVAVAGAASAASPAEAPPAAASPGAQSAGAPAGGVRSLLDVLKLAEPMRDVVKEAEGVWPSKLACLLMLLVSADALWISRGLVLFEWHMLGWFCAGAYAALLALIVFGCARVVRIWRKLERVLARVAPLPVTDAFARIPADLITSFKRPWDVCVIEVWQRHCHRVFAGLRDSQDLARRWSTALDVTPEGLQSLLAAPVELQRFLEEPVGRQIEQAETTKAGPPTHDETWTKVWEEFLAMRLVAFIQYVRAHLANFGAVVTAALLPALWATTFYPLRENRFLLMLVLVLAAAAVAISAMVALQMNSNYVLSKLEGTPAGRVTWDRTFVIKLLIHVALPLLTIISLKFPELARSLGALMGPLSHLSIGG